MKTLYIHIGTPKTGTTSLQNFLEDNQAELLKHGVYYPLNLDHYVSPKGSERLGSGNFVPAFQHILLYDELTEKTKHDLRNAFSVADIVLLSTEFLWGADQEIAYATFYKNLREALPKITIKVIVYLRPQIDWLESMYKERIKVSKKTNTLQDIYYDSSIYEPSLHYYYRLCKIGMEIGDENIIVRTYDKEQFTGGNIFADFLNIFNLPLTDAYSCSYTSNPTLPNDFIECIRRINMTESISLQEYGHIFSHVAIKEGNEKWKSDGYPPHLSIFTIEQRHHFMERFKDENQKLAQRFLHRDTLFRQEFYGESCAKPVEESEVLTAAIRIFTTTIVKLNQRCDRQQQAIDELRQVVDKLNRRYDERWQEVDELRNLGRIRLKVAALRMKVNRIFHKITS